ncbi:hypothetical protein NQ317_003553 [Molorchus minor]|uniref:Uncharacterized protein n=1 Tax=Molorchus minor TaxID=1323400 RepID=A0ABQ9ISZ6_9CUCU|nr:hypothetical protein NQ317_003553 [Molorchus minor]
MLMKYHQGCVVKRICLETWLEKNVKHLRKQCLKIAIEMVLTPLFCIENGPVTEQRILKLALKNKMLLSVRIAKTIAITY